MSVDKENILSEVIKKIWSLKTEFISKVKVAINNELGESGSLDNYKVVWNQLERLGTIVVKEILENNFSGCSITIAKSKSAYPDVKMEYKGLTFAFDIKSNESSKEPWYDIGRLDTFVKSRLSKYDEEYDLVVKYDSKNGKVLEIYFETLRDTVGLRAECNGVKYRPYDGKVRPKSWKDFSDGKSYWRSKEEFLKGLDISRKFRFLELIRGHLKGLTKEEIAEFKKLFE